MRTKETESVPSFGLGVFCSEDKGNHLLYQCMSTNGSWRSRETGAAWLTRASGATSTKGTAPEPRDERRLSLRNGFSTQCQLTTASTRVPKHERPIITANGSLPFKVRISICCTGYP